MNTLSAANILKENIRKEVSILDKDFLEKLDNTIDQSLKDLESTLTRMELVLIHGIQLGRIRERARK